MIKMSNNSELAEKFVQAISLMASKEDNLFNFQSYLSQHFDVWLKKFAYTPEGITSEFVSFANMNI